MKKDSQFHQQAELMLRLLPIVNREKCFGLKGGTAINFFVRDMPRLSVDIDLAYLPIEDRDTSLAAISTALNKISEGIKKAFPITLVRETIAKTAKQISKLVVSPGPNQVKIETNDVLRGAIYGTEERRTTALVEQTFETSTTIRCLSLADLYGGKICALLDRQHPRDMFDVMELLDNEGITRKIRRAFVHLLSRAQSSDGRVTRSQPEKYGGRLRTRICGYDHNRGIL